MDKVLAYKKDAYDGLKEDVDQLRSEAGSCLAVVTGTVGAVVYDVPTGKYFNLRHVNIYNPDTVALYVDIYEGTAGAATSATRKMRIQAAESIPCNVPNIYGKVFTADVSVQLGTSVEAFVDVGGILYTP